MPKLRTPQPVAPPPPTVPAVPIADKAALTVLEVAELMSLGSTSVRLLIKSGKLRAVRVGKALIIARAEVERFLETEAAAPAMTPRYAMVLRALAQAHAGIAVAKQADAVLKDAIAGYRVDAAAAEMEQAVMEETLASAERAEGAS
jgi:excisionase family DNA binding protein